MISDMQKLAETAERLRNVRRAHERFLAVWAVECIWDQPKPLDRVRDDIERHRDEQSHSLSR